jgi:hypothetical protein
MGIKKRGVKITHHHFTLGMTLVISNLDFPKIHAISPKAFEVLASSYKTSLRR